jgi:hypothetical protein
MSTDPDNLLVDTMKANTDLGTLYLEAVETIHEALGVKGEAAPTDLIPAVEALAGAYKAAAEENDQIKATLTPRAPDDTAKLIELARNAVEEMAKPETDDLPPDGVALRDAMVTLITGLANECARMRGLLMSDKAMLRIADGAFDMPDWAAALVAFSFSERMKSLGAENFLTLDFPDSDGGPTITVTAQVAEKVTPARRIAQLEAENVKMRQALSPHDQVPATLLINHARSVAGTLDATDDAAVLLNAQADELCRLKSLMHGDLATLRFTVDGFDMKSWVVPLFAMSFDDFLTSSPAEHFVTTDLTSPESGNRITVTVGRHEGKSPAEVIAELRERIKFYARRLAALQSYQPSLPEPFRTAVCDILANGSERTWSRPAEPRGDVFLRIQEERDYQDQVWGTVADNVHPMEVWLNILGRLAAKAKLVPSAEVPAEVRQIAAVAVAFGEQYGFPARGSHPEKAPGRAVRLGGGDGLVRPMKAWRVNECDVACGATLEEAISAYRFETGEMVEDSEVEEVPLDSTVQGDEPETYTVAELVAMRGKPGLLYSHSTES